MYHDLAECIASCIFGASLFTHKVNSAKKTISHRKCARSALQMENKHCVFDCCDSQLAKMAEQTYLQHYCYSK